MQEHDWTFCGEDTGGAWYWCKECGCLKDGLENVVVSPRKQNNCCASDEPVIGIDNI